MSPASSVIHHTRLGSAFIMSGGQLTSHFQPFVFVKQKLRRDMNSSSNQSRGSFFFSTALRDLDLVFILKQQKGL